MLAVLEETSQLNQVAGAGCAGTDACADLVYLKGMRASDSLRMAPDAGSIFVGPDLLVGPDRSMDVEAPDISWVIYWTLFTPRPILKVFR